MVVLGEKRGCYLLDRKIGCEDRRYKKEVYRVVDREIIDGGVKKVVK